MKNINTKLHTVLLVGVDFSEKDKGVLIVGVKQPNQDVKVINAFQDKEAYELFQKLIGKKESDNS